MRINQGQMKMKRNLYVRETVSTNELLWALVKEQPVPEGFYVHAGYQWGGKGQAGNSWESERGKNLLFSMVFYPGFLPPDELFFISQLVSVGIKKTLDEYTGNITIKWPNDIYFEDKKLGGILIENSLQGTRIKAVVAGIGLNVNQNEFVSDAPNPVSLRQITGRRVERSALLRKIIRNILDLYANEPVERIRSLYEGSLFRRVGYFRYRDDNGDFMAKINAIQPDGQLELETTSGEIKLFYFKEVSCVF